MERQQDRRRERASGDTRCYGCDRIAGSLCIGCFPAGAPACPCVDVSQFPELKVNQGEEQND